MPDKQKPSAAPDKNQSDNLNSNLGVPPANLSAWQVVKRVFRDYLFTHRWPLIVGSGAGMMAGISGGLYPYIMKLTADQAITNRNTEYFYLIPLFIVILAGVRSVAVYASSYSRSRTQVKVTTELRTQLFAKLIDTRIPVLEAVPSNHFNYATIYCTDRIGECGSLIIGTLESIVRLVVLAATMLILNVWLTLLTLVSIPITLLLLRSLSKLSYKYSKLRTEQESATSSFFIARMNSARIVKAFTTEADEKSRFNELVSEYEDTRLRASRVAAAVPSATEITINLLLAVLISVASLQAFEGNITVGDFLGFMAATILSFGPIRMLLTLPATLNTYAAEANVVFGILDLNEDESDKDLPAIKVEQGHIEFKDVRFNYSNFPVLRGISFSIKAGSRVALVGPSGAGKSTIFSLLLRFFDPVSGEILVDGQDITKYSRRTLREEMSLVSQSPYVFDDTLRENIIYGAGQVTSSELHDAIESSSITDLISEERGGLSRSVGERGVRLSQGEQQRISIARSILRNAKIVLLDEPTSSLDALTESRIQEALDELTSKHTVLTIAHRLSTIQHADHILVMEDGGIVEQGSHSELVALKGTYSRLYQHQQLIK